MGDPRPVEAPRSGLEAARVHGQPGVAEEGRPHRWRLSDLSLALQRPGTPTARAGLRDLWRAVQVPRGAAAVAGRSTSGAPWRYADAPTDLRCTFRRSVPVEGASAARHACAQR